MTSAIASPTVSRPPSRVASPARTVLLLAAAAAVASAANAAVAAAAIAAGADPSFGGLRPAVFIAFGVVGLLAGFAGWTLVRRLAARPARALRVLVPVVLLLSFAPDLLVALTRAIPGTTVTGMVGLALMHVVVVAVGMPVYRRIAPVG